MSYENVITDVVSNQLKNPIPGVLKQVKIASLLKRSKLIKKDGASTSTILLHFIYMLVMNKSVASFIKYSKESLSKDVYCRALKNPKYQWQKLLLLTTMRLIANVSRLQELKAVKVLILDDTIEDKTGKKIEGVCDNVYSNKAQRAVRGLNMVSLTYNDGYSNFLIDFALKFNKKLKIKVEDFKHQFYHTSTADKRKQEGLQTKLAIAAAMVKRALKAGVRADYLLVDSWYAKPKFIKEIKALNLDVIARMANNPRIWQFANRYKTLSRTYEILIKTARRKRGNYNKIKYTYCSTVVTHKSAGRVKVVFLKTKNRLIPILSTNTGLTDERIIEIYKKRWNIEQGYKELREYFGFGKEENRIYEALMARITLSFLSYNIVSYINRINHEPQTLGGLFKDLECELTNLAISMEFFIQILEGIAHNMESTQNDEKANILLAQIIGILRTHTKNEMNFMCES